MPRTEDAWTDGDTLADWAEDAAGQLVRSTDLSAGHWRYWARKIPRRDGEGEMTPTTGWGNLGP